MTNRALSPIEQLLLLVQFTDSALPIGGFSFSGGLETAVARGVVHNEDTLRQFLGRVVRQGALCDGVAALEAHRAISREDWPRAFEADGRVGLFKVGDESRQMSLRMGRKLCDLVVAIVPESPFLRWAQALQRGEIEGHYAPTLGVLYAFLGLGPEALFASYLYGLAGQLTGAALRLMRIDHLAVRRLLFELGPSCEELYAKVRNRSLEQMEQFAPELEILASLHERGPQRMFMN